MTTPLAVEDDGMASDERKRPQGLRLLVVDDDPDAADMLALLLQLEGHDVGVARDGPTALEAALAEPPDVVLLDIGLPYMDGFEVARRLRSHKSPKRPLLIAVTGHGEEAERLRAYDVGIDLHLTKPVGIDELRQFLARYQAVTVPHVG
jgi:DNA-binding response OmpR family regulator